MKKQILSIVCIIAMICAMLVGCSGNKAPSESQSVPSETSSAADNLNTDVSITADNVTEFSVVIADEASDDFKMGAAMLRTSLSSMFGRQLKTIIDKQSESANVTETANEIVIGTSRRPSNKAIFNQLRIDDYAIGCFDGRIYIIGGSEAATLAGVKTFEEKYVNKTDKKIEIKGGTCDTVKNTEKSYPLLTVQIDGVNIRDYNIVIPAESDLSAKSAAEQFSAWFVSNAGYPLNIVTDSDVESEYEILIGATNRTASKSELKPDVSKLEYVLYKNGKKIVVLGDSFMVGGGLGAITAKLALDGKDAAVNITDIPVEAKVDTFKFKEAKNAIIMIGDGMGFNQIEMSLPIIDNKFIASDLPAKGESKTDNVYGTTTDSAAGGTALSTGYKTSNGTIGRDKTGKDLLNLRELAHSLGAKTAVITNDDITGATPSCFLAHNDSRQNTDKLLEEINKLIDDGKVDIAKGSVGDELNAVVSDALKTISADNSRFFMAVEEARIDKESHSNNIEKCKLRVKTFNETIATVIQFVLMRGDTVMVVTADHETGGLTKMPNDTFVYSSTGHTSVNVPIYAIGAGTEIFNGQQVENVEIAKFLAKTYGENNFGQ